MQIGILSLQGDVSEHMAMMNDARKKLEISGKVIAVKNKKEIRNLNALVIPGGESTTLSKLISLYKIDRDIKNLAEKGIPILGTCAGLVLLAKECDEEVEKTGQLLLGLMDMRIKRNAFGRQRESFETDIEIPVLGNEKYHAIFIRAPVIENVGKNVEILARYNDRMIAAQHRNIIAVAFHPELSNDTRLYKYFLKSLK